MSGTLPFKYCPSCGEKVYTYMVQTEGGQEVRCSSCGLPLDVRQPAESSPEPSPAPEAASPPQAVAPAPAGITPGEGQVLAPSAAPPVAAPAPSPTPVVAPSPSPAAPRATPSRFTSRKKAVPPVHAGDSADCVLLGDDSAVFRTLVSDLLVKKQIAKSVIPCSSGVELLSVAAERLHKGLPIRLIVLDILMQPLDGLATALSLRALEKGFHLPAPIPLLFLSAVRSDDTLRRFIGKCQPALYLNKASDSTPEQLGDRIEKVVAYLLQGRGPVLASR